jgi:hypothetical protein
MQLRRSPLPGGGRVPLRGELSLLPVPGRDRFSFKPFAGIGREKLEVTRGEDRVLVVGDEQLNDTRCGVCGSLLFSVVRDGQYVHVALGSLVTAPTIRPTQHIFVGSKADWFEITDDLPQFQELD